MNLKGNSGFKGMYSVHGLTIKHIFISYILCAFNHWVWNIDDTKFINKYSQNSHALVCLQIIPE